MRSANAHAEVHAATSAAAAAADAIPPEAFVPTSSGLVIAGLALVAGVFWLGAFIYASRGERKAPDGTLRPDLLNKYVTVQEIAAKYRTTWAPTAKRNFVFSVAWAFLLVWLFMTGVYLVAAGAADRIEVFRDEAHVLAAGCVAGALVLCGVWLVVFREGSYSKSELEVIAARQRQYDIAVNDEVKAQKAGFEDAVAVDVDRVRVDPNANNRVWLQLAFGILAVAWLLALVATARLQAWTLPGREYGMLVFVAPGYGLFAGWLLYAASLNFGIVYTADSSPDGSREPPASASPYAYRGSVWPVPLGLLAAVCAVAIPDPTQPVPLVLGIAVGGTLFTHRYNLAGVALGLVGVGVGTYEVWRLRGALDE